MTTLHTTNAPSGKTIQTTAAAARKHLVLQTARFTLGGASVTLAMYIYLWLHTREWQLLALAFNIAAYISIALASIILTQRERVKGGISLILVGILVVVAGGTLLASGLGRILGIGAIIVLPLLVLQMHLSSRLTRLSIGATIAIGIAALLLDLYWPFSAIERLAVPYIRGAYPVVIVVVAALSIFLVAQQFSTLNLGAKFMLIFVLVTTIPFVLLATLNDYLTNRQLTDAANERLFVAASQTANEIDAFIGANMDALGVEAQLPTWVALLELPPERRPGSPQEAEAKIILGSLGRKSQSGNLPNIWSYALLDANGVNVLDTRPQDVYNDESGADYFQQARQLKPGQTYVSPVEFLPPAFTGLLHFSSPVINTAGEAIGVLRVSYNADTLQQHFINPVAGLAGRGSFALLFDEKGLCLAHGGAPAQALMFVTPPTPAWLEQLRSARRLPVRAMPKLSTNLPELGAALRNAAPRTFFTAQVIEGKAEKSQLAFASLRRQQWVIAFAQPQAVFLAPMEQQSRLIYLLFMAVAGAVALSAFGLGQIFTRPILHLTQTAHQLAEGNLQVRAEAQMQDETGLLANAFNAMAAQLSELIGSLESRVEARTAQLRASAQVARAASSILDPQQLMQQTVDLICDQFGYYYAAIFLLDEDTPPDQPRYARLRAGRGEPGQIMLARGHKFELGSGMVGWVCANNKARIALDVGQDAVRFANPLLPNTRSEIALPLQVGGRTVGALDVQSEKPAAFDASDIAVLQGMADQIAVALENARLFAQAQSSLAQTEQLIAQIQTSLKETSALYAAGQALSAAADRAAIFRTIIDNLLSPDVDLCLLILFDPYETDRPEQLEINQLWARNGQTALSAGMRFDFANFPLHYFMQADRSDPISTRQVQEYAAAQKLWEQLGMNALAFVPLSAAGRWIGALGIGVAHEGTLDETLLRPYRAIASQLAAAIENLRLFEAAQANLRELNTLYSAYTREAWAAALQARPQLAEYEHVRADRPPQQAHVFRVPLTVRGHEIGLLELEGSRPTWSDQERALAEAVATQVALALDSARLFDQTQRLAGRERLINEITARIRASASVAAILQTAARELAQAMNVPHAVARIQIKESE